MPKIDFPAFDSYRQSHGFQGVFVEGCVDRGDGSSFRARAHAHTAGNNKGWICVRSRKRLFMSDGRPSMLMLHEIAHIITGHGHTDTWRAKLREIGGRVRAHERKRPRTKHNWEFLRTDRVLSGGEMSWYRCTTCPASHSKGVFNGR